VDVRALNAKKESAMGLAMMDFIILAAMMYYCSWIPLKRKVAHKKVLTVELWCVQLEINAAMMRTLA